MFLLCRSRRLTLLSSINLDLYFKDLTIQMRPLWIKIGSFSRKSLLAVDLSMFETRLRSFLRDAFSQEKPLKSRRTYIVGKAPKHFKEIL